MVDERLLLVEVLPTEETESWRDDILEEGVSRSLTLTVG